MVKSINKLILISLLLAVSSCFQSSLLKALRPYLRRANLFRQSLFSSLTEDSPLNVGMWVTVLYRGTWESSSPKQMNFIPTSKGMLFMRFDYDPENKNVIEFYFELYEDEYIEDKFILSVNKLDLFDDKKSQLSGNYVGEVDQIDKIFSTKGEKLCQTATSISLTDLNGKPVDVSTDEVLNLMIQGTVVSLDCNINFSFKITPSFVDFGRILIFSFLAIGFIVMGMNPLYNAIRENNVALIMNLSDGTLLCNIMIDMIVIVINTTMGMRSLIEYFEFFTLITMFLMISILFKIRFYLYIFELRASEMALNAQDLQNKKFFFLLKFVSACIFSIVLANFLIYYYYLFLLVFLYPCLQILHNCYNVIRKNCFYWSLHFTLIFSQVFYPAALRGFPGNIFRLRSDYHFMFLLLSAVVVQLSLMFFQKYFGPSFFLPRFLLPNYFNYFKKIKNLAQADQVNCPICFIPLTDHPEVTGDLLERIMLSTYMETPCKHRFHEVCLQQWMEHKLVCPCCRTKIPPY